MVLKVGKGQKLKEGSHNLESALLEKTVTYETDEGAVTEKISLNYKYGNFIDKAINEVKGSEYIKKAGDTAKTTLRGFAKFLFVFGIIAAILFVLAIMGGVVQR